MNKTLILCAIASTAFAFKPMDTHPQAVHVGVHSASLSGETHHGVSVNYEKVAPSSAYAGADFSALSSDAQTRTRAEVRFGYTAEKIGEMVLTPFASFGVLSVNPSWLARKDYSTSGLGCLLNLASNQYFNMGVAVQGMRLKGFKNTVSETFYGWEASYVVRVLPEVMDVEIKPYFTKLNSFARERHFGVKTSIGYAF